MLSDLKMEYLCTTKWNNCS